MWRKYCLRLLKPRLYALAILIITAPAISFAQGTTEPASWPHTITVGDNSAVVYQPQAISWPDHTTLTARAALAITPHGAKAPILGTIELTLKTTTDAATNMVVLTDPQLQSSRFPALDTEQAAHIDQEIRKALPGIKISAVPLNSILLSLKQQGQPEAAQVNNDPPAIFYSDKPASLVVFDGDPVMAPAGNSGLTYAVNTNWDVFRDGTTWYLLNNGTWLAAQSFSGPFQAANALPAAFSTLRTDKNFPDLQTAVPLRKPQGPVPAIFISTKPAEIIVTQGAAQLAPIAGTGLQVVKNTNSAVFFVASSKQYFVQISGRWFSASSLSGPWAFATANLPADFSLLPPDGQYGSLLTSVPGTSQAQLAVLQADVPKQATLKKDQAKLTVVYAGAPQFAPIPGTSLKYAVNTHFQVLEVDGRYYACYQGAWFEAPTPKGAWVLAASVPASIYAIPPTSPLYPVTFVKVYAVTPVAVTYGYTAGYMMGYVTAGTVVYGTGYYYPPVVIPGPVPVFYAYPYSYVGSVSYNSTTGAWTRGGAVYGPYGGTAQGHSYYNPTTGAYGHSGSIYGPNGGVGGFSYYNPSTGGYAHGSASWNANGGAAQASYYNPRTGVTGSTSQNSNPYERWGSSTFTGPNQTVNTKSGSNANGSAGGFKSSTGAEGAGYRGAGGNQGGAVKTQNGDVYAGHDGNVYQHSSSGWSQWNNGGWQPVNPPSSNANTTRSSTTPSASGNAAANSANNRFSGSNRSSQQPTMESSSYQQLEQDRQARTSGTQGFGGGRFGGGSAGASRSGGGGRSGGGRFQR